MSNHAARRIFAAMRRPALAGAAALATLAGSAAQSAGPAEQAALEIGRTLYEQRCANCHGQPGESSTLAPTLAGIIGRRAGSVPGFAYSRRFAGSEHVWTRDSLDAWLASVTVNTPDLAARHLGVADAFERQMLLAYLASEPR